MHYIPEDAYTHNRAVFIQSYTMCKHRAYFGDTDLYDVIKSEKLKRNDYSNQHKHRNYNVTGVWILVAVVLCPE